MSSSIQQQQQQQTTVAPTAQNQVVEANVAQQQPLTIESVAKQAFAVIAVFTAGTALAAFSGSSVAVTVSSVVGGPLAMLAIAVTSAVMTFVIDQKVKADQEKARAAAQAQAEAAAAAQRQREIAEAEAKRKLDAEAAGSAAALKVTPQDGGIVDRVASSIFNLFAQYV